MNSKLVEATIKALREDETFDWAAYRAYNDKEKQRKLEFLNNLDMEPLFAKIREVVNISDLTFEADKVPGEMRIDFKSNNIVDKIGVLQLAFKEMYISSFGNGVATRRPSEHDQVDMTKEYDIYYWVNIHFSYVHIDGGTNGAGFATARFINNEWQFELDKDARR